MDKADNGGEPEEEEVTHEVADTLVEAAHNKEEADSRDL